MTIAKPFVQVACICEKVLVEPDSVPSLIRVVDTYFIDLPSAPLPPSMKTVLELILFVSLKSGDVVGEHEVGIRLITPDQGEDGSVRKNWKAEFRGGEAGVNVKLTVMMPEPKFGLYWFDVLWGDEVLSRIPLRLKPKESQPTGDEAAPTETVTS